MEVYVLALRGELLEVCGGLLTCVVSYWRFVEVSYWRFTCVVSYWRWRFTYLCGELLEVCGGLRTCIVW